MKPEVDSLLERRDPEAEQSPFILRPGCCIRWLLKGPLS